MDRIPRKRIGGGIMTESEAITYLRQVEGFDKFHVETAQIKLIYAGQHGTGRARLFKFEDGKLYECVAYFYQEDRWNEIEIVQAKLKESHIAYGIL
jgi:hypothetical protein